MKVLDENTDKYIQLLRRKDSLNQTYTDTHNHRKIWANICNPWGRENSLKQERLTNKKLYRTE